MDNGNLVFYKNNTSQGTAYSSGTFSGKTIMPAVGNGGGATVTYTLNAGQRPFAYTAPSGFKALCTANLPAPLVTKPSTVMDVVTYTGTGATRSITGLGFSPDFVWIKERGATAGHNSYDIVRGASVYLASESTNAEGTDTDALTSFNSDGFSLGSGYTVKSANGSGRSYVAWTWDAGSSTVTNTQGSITSQVRANASAGFSIVTYTGTGSSATVGHGLGVEPHLIITKNRSNGSYGWYTYAKAVGNTKYLILEGTAAATTFNLWQDTTPTSSVFYLSSNAAVMNNGNNYVAYCFAPVVGYSSFGSYVGNGSSDGSFVYTGFRPRLVMIKCSTAVFDWRIFDTSRSDANGANVVNYKLYPNTSGAENGSGGDNSSTNNIDILSNGFKLRTANGATNDPQTYIYAAFAESPFNYARAR
jgi:hypothetical protein